MILVDFSGLMYQNIFSAIKVCNPRMNDDKYITDDYINYAFYRVFEILFDIQDKFTSVYSNIVICLDKTSKHNWRKDIYKNYKLNRKTSRDASGIDYKEVFEKIDEFVEILKTNTPYKVVEVEGAEADDVILCLTKYFSEVNNQKVLIISSDKDMIQAQKFKNVSQYSFLTQKFISIDTKQCNSLTEWLEEHIILGDVCDNVPRIVDDLKFSENFNNFLISKNLKITPFQYALEEEKYADDIKDYNIYKKNKKNEDTTLDIFEKPRFGVTNIKKMIKLYGSLKNWINSNEHLKYNFERNCRLILEEFIPKDIYQKCIDNYKTASTTYDYDKFRDNLKMLKIENLEIILPSNFLNGVISFKDFIG